MFLNDSISPEVLALLAGIAKPNFHHAVHILAGRMALRQRRELLRLLLVRDDALFLRLGLAAQLLELRLQVSRAASATIVVHDGV